MNLYKIMKKNVSGGIIRDKLTQIILYDFFNYQSRSFYDPTPNLS